MADAENACFEKVQAYALRQEKHSTKIRTVAAAEGTSAEQQRGYLLRFRLCRYRKFQNRRVKQKNENTQTILQDHDYYADW